MRIGEGQDQGTPLSDARQWSGSERAAVTVVDRALAIELRCPTAGCHSLVLTYVPSLGEPVTVTHRCRRCRQSFDADLRAGSPIVRLRSA